MPAEECSCSDVSAVGSSCLCCCRQLPIVKAACCNLIEQSLCEETVPSSLEIADRCLTPEPLNHGGD